MPYSLPLSCSNPQCSISSLVLCPFKEVLQDSLCWLGLHGKGTVMATVQAPVPSLSSKSVYIDFFLMRYSTACANSVEQPTLVFDFCSIEK